MTTMTPMVEYLLALRKPGGGQLVRYGAMQFTIPIFPPGMSITWQTYPYFGSYCSIDYWHRYSPAMVPGAFTLVASHAGMVVQAGLVGASILAESHNTWLEITESSPYVVILTNVSGVNQFFEGLESFLLVDSEESLEMVREVVRHWGAYDPVVEALRETNQLLRQLAGGLPVPYPSI